MRSLSSRNLELSDYETLLASSEVPRVRGLLKWLSNTDADAVDILDWLAGNGVSIHRLESPSQAILNSLPLPSELLEPVAREVFTSRLAQAIEWLVSDPSILSSFSIDTWSELFDIARRLNDPLLQRPIITLLETFDAIGISPFVGEREMRRDFTDLVRMYQFDNRLASRWTELACNAQADQVLYASLVDAMLGVLSMPEPIDFHRFYDAFSCFCHRIDQSPKEDEAKTDLFTKLRNKTNLLPGASTYLDLGVAAFCGDYSWLPQVAGIERLTALTTDLAVLSNVMTFGPRHLFEMARVKYKTICGELGLDPQLDSFPEIQSKKNPVASMETLMRYGKLVSEGC